jgi:acetyl esterase
MSAQAAKAFHGAPGDLRALMMRIGPVWSRDIRANSALVKEAYRPVLAAAPKAGVDILRDQAYGSHPRQVLDLFIPSIRRKRPVVVFVHGGAFVRGEKRTDEQMYDNVLYWFARQGFIGINIEYRAAPSAPYPAGADDVAAAIDWIHRKVSRHDGDSQRIFLVGHSAGGTHVASYACDPALGYLGEHVAGIALISARLRADDLPENPNAEGVRSYFGKDREVYDSRSPISHCAHWRTPVLLAIAEHENPLLDVYGLEMAWRLAQVQRKAPRLICMKAHNHMSIVAHFNTAENYLGREIVEFFKSVPAGATGCSAGTAASRSLPA